MSISCTLELYYKSAEKASQVAKAIQVDDEEFVETCVVGNKIVSKVEAKNIPSLLHTLNDYLECVSVAEKVVTKNYIKRKK